MSSTSKSAASCAFKYPVSKSLEEDIALAVVDRVVVEAVVQEDTAEAGAVVVVASAATILRAFTMRCRREEEALMVAKAVAADVRVASERRRLTTDGLVMIFLLEKW